MCFEKSAIDMTKERKAGRPYGGLCTYVHMKFASSTSVLVKNERFLALKVGLIMLVNVYMPCSITETNADQYKEILDSVAETFHNSDCVKILACGDYNTSYQKAKPFFSSFLSDLELSDCSSSVDYTYIANNVNNSHSKIDFVLFNNPLAYESNLVKDIALQKSGHFPLLSKIKTSSEFVKSLEPEPLPNKDSVPDTDWDRVSESQDNQFLDYVNWKTAELLLMDIDEIELLIRFSKILEIGAILCLPQKRAKKSDSKTRNEPIPNFEEDLKPLKDQCRFAQNLWELSGKPRDGPIARNFYSARSRWQKSYKQAQKELKVLKQNKIAESFLDQSKQTFGWRALNLHEKANTFSPVVENAAGRENIRKHFFNLYKSKYNLQERNFESTANRIDAATSSLENFSVTNIDAVIKIIHDLDPRKATFGTVSARHLQHSLHASAVVITKFFNGILKYSFSQLNDLMTKHSKLEFLESVIKPIIKKPGMDISKEKSYRPICISSIFQVVLEEIIKPHLNKALDRNITKSQHGYAKNRSTETAVAMFKMLIKANRDAYRAGLTVVLLDASAAFEGCQHDIVFCDLLDNGVPPDIVKTLAWLYRSTRIRVFWQDTISEEYFCQTAGVKQGGVCSAIIFRQYTYPLSAALSKHPGLSLLGSQINHIGYADDFLLICFNSAIASRLLKVCWDFGKSHFVKWNSTKTKVIRLSVNRSTKFNCYSALSFPGQKPLDEVTSDNWLGYQLSYDLSDKSHIEKQTQRLNFVANQISTNVNPKKFEHRVKRTVANAYGGIYLIGCMNSYTIATFSKLTRAHRYFTATITHTYDRGSFLQHLEPDFLNFPDFEIYTGVGALLTTGKFQYSDVRSRWLYSKFDLKTPKALMRFAQYRIDVSLAKILDTDIENPSFKALRFSETH